MTTLNKPIKRTVTKLDTSGQINLFAETMAVRITPEKPLGSICFIDPNLQAIKLRGRQLDLPYWCAWLG